jgi:hypothetical protein
MPGPINARRKSEPGTQARKNCIGNQSRTVHFLVQEGQISLDSLVSQAQPSKGLGLKFQTVATKDISKLTLLLDRVHAAFRANATACRSEA